MNDIKPFVILFTPRTGSTHFQYRLKSPWVFSEGEKLLAIARETDLTEAERSEQQIRYIVEIGQVPLAKNLQAQGVRVNLEYVFDQQRFAQTLRDIDFSVFHVRRRNLVKTALSRINQRALLKLTGRGHVFAAQEGLQLPPLTAELKEFDRELQLLKNAATVLEEFVATLGLPTMLVDYEDLISNEDEVIEAAFDFLGIPHSQTTAGVKKVTDDNLRRAIANFDELATHYRGTEFEHMLLE